MVNGSRKVAGAGLPLVSVLASPSAGPAGTWGVVAEIRALAGEFPRSAYQRLFARNAGSTSRSSTDLDWPCDRELQPWVTTSVSNSAGVVETSTFEASRSPSRNQKNPYGASVMR